MFFLGNSASIDEPTLFTWSHQCSAILSRYTMCRNSLRTIQEVMMSCYLQLVRLLNSHVLAFWVVTTTDELTELGWFSLHFEIYMDLLQARTRLTILRMSGTARLLARWWMSITLATSTHPQYPRGRSTFPQSNHTTTRTRPRSSSSRSSSSWFPSPYWAWLLQLGSTPSRSPLSAVLLVL